MGITRTLNNLATALEPLDETPKLRRRDLGEPLPTGKACWIDGDCSLCDDVLCRCEVCSYRSPTRGRIGLDNPLWFTELRKVQRRDRYPIERVRSTHSLATARRWADSLTTELTEVTGIEYHVAERYTSSRHGRLYFFPFSGSSTWGAKYLGDRLVYITAQDRRYTPLQWTLGWPKSATHRYTVWVNHEASKAFQTWVSVDPHPVEHFRFRYPADGVTVYGAHWSVECKVCGRESCLSIYGPLAAYEMATRQLCRGCYAETLKTRQALAKTVVRS